MKIELKNVKHSESLSQETNAFTATIYVDGKKAGDAENHGQGGCTNIHPRDLEQRINEWAKTLPERNIYEGTDEPAVMVAQTAETIVDELLTNHLIRSDMRKSLSKRVLYTRTDKPGIFQTKPVTPAQKAQVLASADVKAKWMVAAFLNDLPEDEALALYRKG